MNPERISGFALRNEVSDSQESLPSSALKVTKKVGGVITEAYFAPKPWEGDGRIYRWVGIRTFKRWIPTGDVLIRFLRRNTGTGLPFYSLSEPNLKEAKKYDLSTRVFETVHAAGLAAFAAGLAGFDKLSFGPDLPGETYINAVATAGNLYAVMLQRYNRARIYSLVKRSKELGESSSTKS
ncbi:hypothetical protein A3D81_01490 [Candidatus Curtissbacteria bacterium RIFCSPHIGHO2_02_FULL_40_17]|uniref:Glycosyl-4,4'-diaponeurosporenoate acyltransferase n=2 Tax=Candidatus Curtissiibacteriota TaxID=1752717 RepID=A0A1F5GIK5_9BACT|nr:MAG: hypothetical protein A3D81_01490 [Candidatus Curtissbacteria bacterium RIFCSPHIGHO2_02_FULL_40_17]OGE04973.1 MAG: hypothetical protein A3F45_02475 [Candidatus Curtissbacteria bacterium RIFCSPHIGHO2_12_FULL_41_17]